MNSTTLHIKRRIGYCGLCLVLLAGLLVQSCTPEQDHPVWDADLDNGVRKRRSRVVCRAAMARRVHIVKQRGLVMLCRMGWMSVLLVWSGWEKQWSRSWWLLSLPLTDALLSILPLFWPRVLKMRMYPYVVRGIHRLYGLALGILLLSGLTGPRKGRTGWVLSLIHI